MCVSACVCEWLRIEVHADRMRTKPQVQALAWSLSECRVSSENLIPGVRFYGFPTGLKDQEASGAGSERFLLGF